MSGTDVSLLEKFCVKFYVADPQGVELLDLIPVFHSWIQAQAVAGLLIDVADYIHVPDGPGIVLVGHEADYSLDRAEGPLGLLYNRKRLGQGSNTDRLCAGLRNALKACHLLEGQASMRFDGHRFRFMGNDRLVTPNDDVTLDALRPDLDAVLALLYPGQEPVVRRDETDPRRRLTLEITTAEPVDVKTLLGRLA